MPDLSRFYHLTPRDVDDMTVPEFVAYRNELEQMYRDAKSQRSTTQRRR